jgi:AraC-like DNA-binding protein
MAHSLWARSAIVFRIRHRATSGRGAKSEAEPNPSTCKPIDSNKFVSAPQQIARAVGYKSPRSFLRAFRQVYGYVPAESEGNGQNSD